LEERKRRLEKRLGISDSAVAEIAWLPATLRQTAPSYWLAKSKRVALHGLLADRRIPDAAVDFEIAYWLAFAHVGSQSNAINAFLIQRGLNQTLDAAVQWRRQSWMRFRNRHHPLTKPSS
jgi:hypothetical protein